ncbi:helix-turn-helix transcriptional regulator [Ruminococcus sp.]|uniref:helix-turn-helix transcriptional regulator n=1 Tax=Ruminococcus sp. TaxID=41978 RepID=UPI003528E016
MQLGQAIAQIRKERGLTQEAFAKVFNVTRQTVSNWENEKSYPDLSTLVKISDEFNVSLDVLLKGDFHMVKDIDKKIKKQPFYIGIIIGLIVIVIALFSFIYVNDKRLSDTTKDYADFMLNSVVSIEIHDSQSGELIIKYGDKSSIDKVNAILDIENWEKVENIDKNISPIYTLELYCNTTKQDTDDDIKEITIYSNGKYVSFFTTSPGVKQNYKANIDITELIGK